MLPSGHQERSYEFLKNNRSECTNQGFAFFPKPRNAYLAWPDQTLTKGIVFLINPFTPRVSYGDIKVILTSESMDEILWCDH